MRNRLLAAAGIAAIAGTIVISLGAPLLGRPRSQAGVAAPPSFEIASVKQNSVKGQGRLRYSPNGIDFADVPLTWIIGEAYQVAFSRISSPDPRVRELLLSEGYFFDIAAKAAGELPKDRIRRMLQTLLADRFKLVLHHENKVEPVYKLAVAKSGSKLHESATPGGEPTAAFGPEGFVIRNMEMPRFCGILSIYMDRPVIDMTGLVESYDFTLKLESTQNGVEAKLTLRDWFMSSLFTDIQKQLGLQLAADKAPIDYLVVDHVEKPSEN
jgi:uncharacterized protein (TIGR03435 family)